MTTVKICGITNLPDALVAAETGADLLGFVFYPKSPRYIEPDVAREIIGALRNNYGVKFVGVFVNEPVQSVQELVKKCEMDLVQLSGDEPAEVVSALCPHVYKALRPHDAEQLDELVRGYGPAVQANSPALLVDAFNPKLYGGTGERADWVLAGKLARQYPILLAGGLTMENVAEAIQTVQPWGVDVSSGVERVPGIKDHDKVRQFIQRAKGDFK